MEKDSGSRRLMEMRQRNYYYQNGVVAYTTDTDGNQNSQNLIGTDGNVLATERFQQNATQYYLYNKDIQGGTSSLVKEDGSLMQHTSIRILERQRSRVMIRRKMKCAILVESMIRVRDCII